MFETPKNRTQESLALEEKYEDAFYEATKYLASLKIHPDRSWGGETESEIDGEFGSAEMEEEEVVDYSLDQVMTNLGELQSKGDETAGTLLSELATAAKNKLKI